MLREDEIKRYSRQMALPGMGRAGQQRLKEARVLVIGAGGTGCPALIYLAAAGVGTIGIADDDVVEISNLQRQVLYRDIHAGHSKAHTAATELHQINPLVSCFAHPVRVNKSNASQLLTDYDVIIDATDNLESRYVIDEACIELEKPFVYGSVYRFGGQLSVFNLRGNNGISGPSYSSVFPKSETSEESCAMSGVLGAVPGMIGTMQSMEVIKIITGMGKPLSGKLLVFNVLTMDFSTFILNHETIEKFNVPEETRLISH
jgi:adenylyltransferase/sulfurtransferase